MVIEPDIFQYLGSGDSMLEDEAFERLSKEGQRAAYRHDGSWSPMDNLHDKDYLEGLWNNGHAPWNQKLL